MATVACGKSPPPTPTPPPPPAASTTCYQGITELPLHVTRPSGHERVATTLRRTVDPRASTITEQWSYDGEAPDLRIYRIHGARYVLETNGRRMGDGELAGPRWAWTGATTYVQLPGATSRTRIVTRFTAERYRAHATIDGKGSAVIIEDLAAVDCPP